MAHATGEMCPTVRINSGTISTDHQGLHSATSEMLGWLVIPAAYVSKLVKARRGLEYGQAKLSLRRRARLAVDNPPLPTQ
jgi:hypothetical protein